MLRRVEGEVCAWARAAARSLAARKRAWGAARVMLRVSSLWPQGRACSIFNLSCAIGWPCPCARSWPCWRVVAAGPARSAGARPATRSRLRGLKQLWRASPQLFAVRKFVPAGGQSSWAYSLRHGSFPLLSRCLPAAGNATPGCPTPVEAPSLQVTPRALSRSACGPALPANPPSRQVRPGLAVLSVTAFLEFPAGAVLLARRLRFQEQCLGRDTPAAAAAIHPVPL
jgi:hypothetical protein